MVKLSKEERARRWKFQKYTVISIASIISFLIIWELCTDVLKLIPSYAFPSPVKVFRTFLSKWTKGAPDGATLGVHLITSFKLSMVGYLIGAAIGIPVGIIMGWYKIADRILKPVCNFIRPIPPIALIPVMIMLLGIGFKARAAVIAVCVFNQTMINAYSGIRQTKEIHLWVARTFGASNLQQLFTVALPTAKPFIFTGLRVAMGSAWMSLVAAEMLASSKGLGYMITVARTLGRPDIVIIGMLMLGAIGLIWSKIFDLLEHLFVKGGI